MKESRKGDRSALLYGEDLYGEAMKPKSRGKISDRFILPPFSVFNACEGFWQERKRCWLDLGIKSEIGRGDNNNAGRCFGQDLVKGENPKFGLRQDADKRSNINNAPLKSDCAIGTGTTNMAPGTSIFDPVLCELIYQWFCPQGGQVVDPFAGGSVRGIVAAMMGLKYWGYDLSEKQIAANKVQGDDICGNIKPQWICGDALDLLDNAPPADLIFTCPPYGDLERYSDDPRDLSTMEYYTFIANLKRIVLRCYKRLNNNRFACFVVGEYRDKKGNYHNFVGDTISAFKSAGFAYYNEAILVTSRGSLPIRITKQFNASRKFGKTHQNILVFVKGRGKEAAKIIGNQ